MNVKQSHHANNTDFLSTDEIADISLDDLVGFILKKAKNHFLKQLKLLNSCKRLLVIHTDLINTFINLQPLLLVLLSMN